MYGLVVIEVMTMSGHLSNIDEIKTGAEKRRLNTVVFYYGV
jgi:hypothetical protein